MNELIMVGLLDIKGDEQTRRVYDPQGLAPTLNTMQGGNRQPKFIVAMRGRDKDNPSDRTAGNTNLEQRLEINKKGLCNTLITVQKDNLVMERADKESNVSMILVKQATKKGFVECKNGGVADLSYPESNTRRGRVQENGMVSPTLTTTCAGISRIEKVGQISSEGSQCGTVVGDNGLFQTTYAETHGYANPHIYTEYRIRKLTPKECWRLMGYKDSDFGKAEQVNSNTQLYKEAGNAIVKSCLMAIFSQLNLKGVKPWNEMTAEERRALAKKGIVNE